LQSEEREESGKRQQGDRSKDQLPRRDRKTLGGRADEAGLYKTRYQYDNAIHEVRADFALRLAGLRPIEREYGSATSGANKAAPARSLSGTKESGRQNCARPARNSQAD
jgi:hypothetical protein